MPMVNTQRALSRRHLLRGMGVALQSAAFGRDDASVCARLRQPLRHAAFSAFATTLGYCPTCFFSVRRLPPGQGISSHRIWNTWLAIVTTLPFFPACVAPDAWTPAGIRRTTAF